MEADAADAAIALTLPPVSIKLQDLTVTRASFAANLAA